MVLDWGRLGSECDQDVLYEICKYSYKNIMLGEKRKIQYRTSNCNVPTTVENSRNILISE